MMEESKSQNPKSKILEARNLRKTYRLGRVDVPVLKGASLQVQPGEWVAVLGASGCGKSTLLHLLGDLDRPDMGDGTIEFQGRSLNTMPASQRNRYRNEAVGFVFQFYHLLPELTVMENAMLHALVQPTLRSKWGGWPTLTAACGVAGMLLSLVGWRILEPISLDAPWRWLVVAIVGALLGAIIGPPLVTESRSIVMRFSPQNKELRQRAARLLESFGLGHRLKHRPRELSGGERQRVAIARALMNNPRVLLADEPTGNLDEKTGEEILDLIAEQHRQGLTIVMVTHDESIARRADRIVHLHDGRVAEA